METRYPFELMETILASITIKRAPDLLGPIEIPVEAEIKVPQTVFPQIQINLKLKSPEEKKLYFEIELIGVFNYVGEMKEFDKKLNDEFVFEKGVHLLWYSARQMIKIITSQMGMNPLNIRIPISVRPD